MSIDEALVEVDLAIDAVSSIEQMPLLSKVIKHILATLVVREIMALDELHALLLASI